MKCGVSLSFSRGRRSGTTQEAGYSVSHSGGRPSGTTQEAGYDVSHSGGRPSGTTQEADYSVTAEVDHEIFNSMSPWYFQRNGITQKNWLISVLVYLICVVAG